MDALGCGLTRHSRRTSIYPLIPPSALCGSVANPDSGRLRQAVSTYVKRCQPPPLGAGGAVRRLVRQSFDEGSPSHSSHGFGSLWKVMEEAGGWGIVLVLEILCAFCAGGRVPFRGQWFRKRSSRRESAQISATSHQTWLKPLLYCPFATITVSVAG